MMGTVIKSVASDTCVFLTVEAIYKDSMSFESYKGQTRLAIWYPELACAYYALEQCLRFLHVIIIKRKIGLCGGLAEVSGTPPYKMQGCRNRSGQSGHGLTSFGSSILKNEYLQLIN